ncbi:MAG: 6-carboxytetrahydropterin synthase QueD [Omnitrophica WOR_2 bacterium RIFCSPHIGHO2_01_FULL_48_9]|nr:MAG: 6-carboxytetrahydropterin synthase QueD [Omnitrophica WOR_2 bacterium RIFCSPHIGHO2_02_FULL_48_11]OGX33164.1 MAG: 6-carboxytetrahydropterin synthase QueD [Omnitrophica WOR_2 bacterium RIFCSPHIGHO2_01_FULL_48_9]
MYELTIKSDFASAHFVRGYQGNCKDLHGHTWKVEVTVENDKLDAIGMVVDFKIIKQQLKDFLKNIDHVCLNDLPHFKVVNPTTENLAKYIFDEFAKVCHPLRIKKVCVWESETSDVTYYKI